MSNSIEVIVYIIEGLWNPHMFIPIVLLLSRNFR